MKKVIVFGKGKFYQEHETFISKHYCIQAFVDNSVSEVDQNSSQMEVPILHPTSLLDLPELPIILMGRHFPEMFDQVKGLGIKTNRLIFGITMPPYSKIEEILFSDGGNIFSENDQLVYCSNESEKFRFSSWDDLVRISHYLLRNQLYKRDPMIKKIADMSVYPASRDFGLSRGKAIDRVYIERFLADNKQFIRGKVLEIAENTYTLRYGEDRVENAYILHINGWGASTIKGNLETGEGIEQEAFDTAIITQTLMFIYGIERVADNIFKLLKSGGRALITVSGISQISRYDAENWGSYFCFHEDAMKKLFTPLFGEENVVVNSYGNVKTAIAMLYGLCYEDLNDADFTINDKDYPVIITVLLHKRN